MRGYPGEGIPRGGSEYVPRGRDTGSPCPYPCPPLASPVVAQLCLTAALAGLFAAHVHGAQAEVISPFAHTLRHCCTCDAEGSGCVGLGVDRRMHLDACGEGQGDDLHAGAAGFDEALDDRNYAIDAGERAGGLGRFDGFPIERDRAAIGHGPDGVSGSAPVST